MSRPKDGWAHVGATLARLADDPPEWVSPHTRLAAEALIAALRVDVGEVLDGSAQEAAADELGISRATLARWRAGWLAEKNGGGKE